MKIAMKERKGDLLMHAQGVRGWWVPELGDEGLIHQHCGLHVQVGQEQLDQPLQSLTDPGALSRLRGNSEEK